MYLRAKAPNNPRLVNPKFEIKDFHTTTGSELRDNFLMILLSYGSNHYTISGYDGQSIFIIYRLLFTLISVLGAVRMDVQSAHKSEGRAADSNHHHHQ